jgi:3'-phosphoadenosine 5'-phosphosulfate sulfotransferase (PAPS reductase)/FAD synthetase
VDHRLRRDQAATRAAVRKVGLDDDHGGLVKVNPLADWSWAEVWDYIRRHRLRYNALHDVGYVSIACPRAPGPWGQGKAAGPAADGGSTSTTRNAGCTRSTTGAADEPSPRGA